MAAQAAGASRRRGLTGGLEGGIVEHGGGHGGGRGEGGRGGGGEDGRGWGRGEKRCGTGPVPDICTRMALRSQSDHSTRMAQERGKLAAGSPKMGPSPPAPFWGALTLTNAVFAGRRAAGATVGGGAAGSGARPLTNASPSRSTSPSMLRIARAIVLAVWVTDRPRARAQSAQGKCARVAAMRARRVALLLWCSAGGGQFGA